MQGLLGISLLLLPLGLHLTPAQISHPPEGGNSKVMAFQEVWAKSMCQPMEQLVDMEQDDTGEEEYTHVPTCVPLLRCSGCCGDENLECQPTLERNITLKVMRVYPLKTTDHVELTFVEHQKCECRAPQTTSNNKSSSESIKNRPLRRKHKKTAKRCS